MEKEQMMAHELNAMETRKTTLNDCVYASFVASPTASTTPVLIPGTAAKAALVPALRAWNR
jgi:hypothetical protein